VIAVTVTDFTPLQSLAGGLLIGFAAVLLMLLHGRVAGISGILGGLLPPAIAPDWAWRAAFLAGMMASPVAYLGLADRLPDLSVAASPGLLLAGGVLVGIGVTYGSGCTSGHGVCGLARLSPRSIVAVATFMATTAATVFVIRHGLGG
jgi:uncharacterized membrane protein YedE/YeeE